jgi:hypothetical protein
MKKSTELVKKAIAEGKNIHLMMVRTEPNTYKLWINEKTVAKFKKRNELYEAYENMRDALVKLNLGDKVTGNAGLYDLYSDYNYR